MRDFAHPFCLSYFLFLFLVLPIAYSQDARTDFNVKYAERRGPAQGCAFRVDRETIFKTLYQKPPIFGPIFGRKPPNDKALPDKRRLIVVVVLYKAYGYFTSLSKRAATLRRQTDHKTQLNERRMQPTVWRCSCYCADSSYW